MREKQKIKDAKQKAAKSKTLEYRQIKRIMKASIIPIPEHNFDNFIDKTIENEEIEIKNSEEKKQNVPPSLDGFTVLGNDKLHEKLKVRNLDKLQLFSVFNGFR